MRFDQIWQGRNCTKEPDTWIALSVPGNIQYDYGVAHGFADVQYSDNYKQYQTLEGDHWEYRTLLQYDISVTDEVRKRSPGNTRKLVSSILLLNTTDSSLRSISAFHCPVQPTAAIYPSDA